MRRLTFTLLVALLVSLAGCPRSAAPPPPPTPVGPAATAPAPETPAAESPGPTEESQPSLPVTADPEAWATYEGPWFTIEYPQGFRVVPRESSITTTEGFDGVSFVSITGHVEFYVYSPQWRGTSVWATVQPGESVERQEARTEGERRVEEVTVRGPEGRYFRTWTVVTNSAENTSHAVGWLYQNAATYAEFAPLYAKFKGSLQQFAD